jgi:hypothetical protein
MIISDAAEIKQISHIIYLILCRPYLADQLHTICQNAKGNLFLRVRYVWRMILGVVRAHFWAAKKLKDTENQTARLIIWVSKIGLSVSHSSCCKAKIDNL